MIIVPTRNPRNAETLVESFKKYDPVYLTRIKFIISEDDIETYPCPTLTYEGPFCFSKSVNVGLREDAPWYLIMGDDCRLNTRAAIVKLLVASNDLGPLAMISPRILGPCGQQDVKWRGKPRQVQVKKYLPFICTFIPREVRDKTGLMDERLIGYGSDDVDYCHRAALAGCTMWTIPDVCVIHEEGASEYRDTGKDTVFALAELNRRIYNDILDERLGIVTPTGRRKKKMKSGFVTITGRDVEGKLKGVRK